MYYLYTPRNLSGTRFDVALWYLRDETDKYIYIYYFKVNIQSMIGVSPQLLPSLMLYHIAFNSIHSKKSTNTKKHNQFKDVFPSSSLRLVYIEHRINNCCRTSSTQRKVRPNSCNQCGVVHILFRRNYFTRRGIFLIT